MSSDRSVIDVVQDWFGEELSPKLVAHAQRLTPRDVVAYCNHVESAAEDLRLPPRLAGQVRPLVENSYDLIGMSLVADDIAIPNVAMPRPLKREVDDFDEPKDIRKPELAADSRHVQDLHEGLGRLLQLKPLIDEGSVRVLPLARDSYEQRAITRIRRDPGLYAVAECLFPKGEWRGIQRMRRELARSAGLPWTDYDETGWIEFAAGFGYLAPELNILIAALLALDLEADPRTDTQAMSEAPTVIAYLAEMAPRLAAYYQTSRQRTRDKIAVELAHEWHDRLQATSQGSSVDTLAMLLRFSVPRLENLSYSDIAAVRRDGPGFTSFRAALRRGLSEAAQPPAGTDWQAYAAAVIRDELSAARAGLDAEIRQSSVLHNALTGTRVLGVSVIGAVAGWAVGGDPTTAIAGAGATAAASSVLSMLEAIYKRHGHRTLLSHYISFEESTANEGTPPDVDVFSRLSVSRLDILSQYV